jgi:Ca2+-binding EF-hand superfamily protein
MGNQVARGVNRMAIAAMANVTYIEKKELNLMMSHFKDLCLKEGNPTMITRNGFTEVLKTLGINQNDSDILDRLFTMYDKTGDDMIIYKDFVVGISPFMSGSYLEKLEFALRLYDTEETGHLRGNDIITVLSQINRVASYFGDPVLTEEQLATLVKEALELPETSLTQYVRYIDYISPLGNHPLVETFLSGGGLVKYGASR